MKSFADMWRTEIALIAFAVGVGVAQLSPMLPSRSLCLAVLAAAVCLGLVLWFRATWRTTLRIAIVAALIGASFSLWRAELRMADQLPTAWEAQDIEIVGVIDELPQADANGVRFAFEVEKVLTADATVPKRIALGWYKPSIKELQGEPLPNLRPGERWQLTVRLKRPHGYANPAGFDTEAWLLENNLRATGSVRGDEPNRLLAANAGRVSDQVHRLRDRLRERMKTALADARYAGVLIALAIGDQRAIAESDWALFNATGVSHLLSISGAHVTLFAGWVAWCVFGLWRRSPACVALLPAQKAAAVTAAVVAVGYALLAGFAVPAQRTCFMLLTAAAALLLNRSLSLWLILLWALVVVLLIDPWAVSAAGFWFSFCAVALLLYVTVGRVGRRPGWQLVLVTQCAVTFGLAPVALALFQQVSIVGPIANAVAIPLITLVVVPLALLWMIVPIDALLRLAEQLIAWLAELLQWLMMLPFPVWTQHAPPWWTVALAIAGCLLLLAPRGIGFRWLGALWCVPLFIVSPARPAQGEFEMTVLDIGQGTSVVIRTAERTLVYDTGPRWTDTSDAGSRLILPYLRASGSSRIDGLVVSHLDIDHSGGANSLLRSTPVGWMLTSVFAEADIIKTASERKIPVNGCRAGQRWAWDGVNFEVLHPSPDSYDLAALKTNDRSCVIKVTARSASALLTADIEAKSEAALVEQYGKALQADALLIPHHGSQTSSTVGFIDAVSPSIAVINAGYRNRFGHPREAVLARYTDRNIPVLRTDWHGAITIRSVDRFATIEKWRDTRSRYWVDRPDPADKRPIE
ncbi:MAG: DNA internalization-related competence protein ComEC/Rec2 [Betaproteobacteria bacterium]|nr:MAG: DNA internalization-related competence protein ComEC/Rec2 [Betaproteobacteria bacterium]